MTFWSWVVQRNRSMNEHCTASGLQVPRVNLTYRWVTQHAASCPLAGVVGCVLPTCAQGLVEPSFSLGWEEGENKWSSSWRLVLLLSILVSVLLVTTWINIRRRHRHSGQRPSRSAAYFPSRGRARWVGRRRWRLSRRHQSSKGVSFYFHYFLFFWWNKLYSFFFKVRFLIFLYRWVCLSLRGSPPHATMMHIRWAPQQGIMGERLAKTL